MNFDLAETAASIALKHLYAGAPLSDAFARIAEAVLPELPAEIRHLVQTVDVGIDAQMLREQLLATLSQEPPGEEINGLCFGLVEAAGDDGASEDDDADSEGTGTNPEVTLYICGSARFDPAEPDWPCDPEWWPESRYFALPTFKALSDAASAFDDDTAWLISAGLIEPLSIVLVGEVCRGIEPATLLGGAPFRGIGSGFDSGDLRDVGVVTREGFASPALLESVDELEPPATPPTPAPTTTTPATTTPKRRSSPSKPSPSKPVKSKTSKAKAPAAKAKPSKTKSSKTKSSKSKSSKSKASPAKRSSAKKGAAKKAPAKKKAAKPAAKKASTKASKKATKRATKKGAKKVTKKATRKRLPRR